MRLYRSPKKARVLIVDDQPANIKVLANLLKDQYQLQVANSGPKALEIAFGNNPPDLILLDIVMPEMDGYAVCKLLKASKATKGIPIIFVTARGSVEDEEYGLSLGAVDYISKPFYPAIVQARVRNQTQRRAAEEALRESERRYRRISERSPVGLFQLQRSPAGHFFFPYVSERMSEITGTPMDTFYQDYSVFFSGIHPDYQKPFHGAILESAEKFTEFQQLLLFMKGEESRWIEIRSIPEPIEDGGVLWNGILIDIHAQKTAEEGLKKEKERLKQILEGTNAGTWECQLQTGEAIINERWAQIIGYRLEEITPLTMDRWFAYLHPQDREQVKDALERHIQGETDFYDLETRMWHKEGHWVWTHGKGKITSWTSDGEPRWMFGTHVDITSRKAAERALKESERRFMNVFYSSQDAILLIHENQFVDCNGATAQMLGCENREEILLSHPSTLSPPLQPDGKDSFTKANEMMLLAQEQGFYRFEWIHRRKNGQEFPVEVSLTPIVHGGKPMLYCIWRDITEIKQAKKDLHFQLQFEKMVSDISSFFISLPAEQIEDGIDHALKTVGSFFQVDRSYIFQFSADGEKMTNTYEWCREGIESQLENIQEEPVENLPWWGHQIRTQEYVVISDVDALPKEAKAEKREFQSQKIQSLICVPIRISGKLFGFLGFDSVEEKRDFTGEQTVLLTVVAEIISNAFARYLTNEKITTYTLDLELQSMELEHVNCLLDEEIDKARRLHENTLPIVRPEIDKLEIYDYNQPASRMGGDFYDYILLKENVLLFYISDITGHGMDAAMMSAFLKNTISTYVKLIPEVGGFHIEKLMDFVFRHYCMENYPDDYFIAMLLGVLDLNTHLLNYMSAGMHISPLLFSQGKIQELPAGGMPISKAISSHQFHYNQYQRSIPLESILFFSTDGLLEQGDGESIYGDRFYDCIRRHHQLPLPVIGEAINIDFASFTGGRIGDDDITYLMMKVTDTGDLPQLKLQMKSSFEEVEKAQERIKRFMQPYVKDEDIVLMALHELLINAVEHGNQFCLEKDVQIYAEVNRDYLLVSVKDEGSGFDWREWTCQCEEDMKERAADMGRGLGFLITKAASDYFYFYFNGMGNQSTFVVRR